MAADHRVVLAYDKTVRIVSPALPGHVRVASPSGRPQLDDGANCAATHALGNNLIMKIIPDSWVAFRRASGAHPRNGRQPRGINLNLRLSRNDYFRVAGSMLNPEGYELGFLNSTLGSAYGW